MSIITWINSTAGLLGALGTLLVGIAALVGPLGQSFKKKEHQPMKEKTRIRKLSFLPGILLITAALVMFVTRSLTGQGQPLNVRLTSQAWDGYNKADYEIAIAKADECIEEFRGAADREQTQLEKDRVPLPPKGSVSEQEKKVIFARGLLNDVATCFYVKGRSAEKLGRKEEAKQAYLAASKYTYARTWDPNGWFWSPAEAASDHLSRLK